MRSHSLAEVIMHPVRDEEGLPYAISASRFSCCLLAWMRRHGAGALRNFDAAATLEKTLVEAIARAEKSVVAIARVKKEPAGESLHLEIRPDPFGRRALLPAAPQPTDPDFLPNEYGTGVVVDRHGLILTAYHVLGEDSDYYVTTADRKVYKATPKAADPRSDLAVLSIEANDLTPITLGDAAKLKKGQIVIALGNPYAIARDGQVSASWGIVSNLARKAPPAPSESDSTGKPTLHHFGTLIQTDAKLNLGTSGGALVNLQGEMVGLTVSWAAAAGFESAAGYAIPIDATFRRVLETLKQGREVEYGFLGVPPGNLQPQEILQGPARHPRFASGARHAGREGGREGRRRHHRRERRADLRRRRLRALGRQAAGRSGRQTDRAPRRPAARDRSETQQVSGARQENRHPVRAALARTAGRISHGRGR